MHKLDDVKICLNHYKQLRKQITERKCVYCTNKDENTVWTLVGNLQASHPAQYDVLKNIIDEVPSRCSWICNGCCSLLLDDTRLNLLISRGIHSDDPIIVCRTKILRDMLDELSKDGIILTITYINQFKHFLKQEGRSNDCITKSVNTFKHVFERVLSKTFDVYTEYGAPGKLYYNSSILNASSMPYMYRNLTSTLKINLANELHALIKQQKKLFPDGLVKFDYRTLVEDGQLNECDFSKYFHKDLEDLLLAATVSNNKQHQYTKSYEFKRTLRVRMAIAILCMTMDRCVCANIGWSDVLCVWFKRFWV